jgi:hypothetical protein
VLLFEIQHNVLGCLFAVTSLVYVLIRLQPTNSSMPLTAHLQVWVQLWGHAGGLSH